MQTMSLEDLNSFHNGHDGGLTNYPKSGDEMDNIFEEIEQLLKNNEGLEIPSKTAMTLQGKSKDNNAKLIADADDINLNFLPACDEQAFLLSSDTQSLPEEELSLYSVNQNELQPVNAPFMVPGIYKKIANAPVLAIHSTARVASAEATNVFFTTKRAKGKIISRNQFENCAAVANQSNEQYEDSVQKWSIEEAKCKSVESRPSDALLKFACSVLKSAPSDQLEIDSIGNEIARTLGVSNRKIIYRLLGPEDLDLHTSNYATTTTSTKPDSIRSFKLKKGRPKKKSLEDANSQASPIMPKKSKVEQSTTLADLTKPFNNVPQPLIRTRSGRVVKSVRPQVNTPIVDEPPVLELEPTKDLIEDAKDKDFKINQLHNSILATEDNLPSLANTSDTVNKRRVPPESICPKCGKIFLGRRLKRHFTQHPDHMLSSIAQEPQQLVGIERPNEEMTLFRYLISKLKNPLLNEDQRADLFLNELNDLIEQLQLRSTRLIRNTSGLHFVNARTARVLGIPEGQYALDMSAIESDALFMDTDQHVYNGEEQKRPQIIAASVSTPSLDYTAISLDDTLTDEAAQKLNLSAGGKLLPPSEESLLRAVDDLVHDGITKLVDANLLQPPRAIVQSSGAPTLVSSHYDHASDNAVEALTIKENNVPHEGTPLLDLSVDFFQFKNN